MQRFRTVLGMSRSGPPSGLPPGYGPSQVKSNGVEPAELTEDDLLICCPTVLGFSFGEKLWGEFYLIYSDIDIPLTSNAAEFAVADIKEIEWSSLPFDCLSIPEEQRDVIMALVEARSDPSVAFDDFVAGKGKGINMLLQYGLVLLIYLNILT